MCVCVRGGGGRNTCAITCIKEFSCEMHQLYYEAIKCPQMTVVKLHYVFALACILWGGGGGGGGEGALSFDSQVSVCICTHNTRAHVVSLVPTPPNLHLIPVCLSHMRVITAAPFYNPGIQLVSSATK